MRQLKLAISLISDVVGGFSQNETLANSTHLIRGFHTDDLATPRLWLDSNPNSWNATLLLETFCPSLADLTIQRTLDRSS